MAGYLRSFIRKLSVDELSQKYGTELLDKITPEQANAINRIIKEAMAQYHLFLNPHRIDPAEEPPPERLERLIDLFPTFLMRIVVTCQDHVQLRSLVRSLLVISTVYLLTGKKVKNQYSSIILNDIDASASLNALNARLIQKSEEGSYTPKQVYMDILAISKSGIGFPYSDKQQVIFESVFCFEGLSQFFILFYLDLLSHAQTDMVAAHVHLIFQSLFVMIRSLEGEFWDKNKNAKSMIDRLLATETQQRLTGLDESMVELFSNELFIYRAGVVGSATGSREKAELAFVSFIEQLSHLSLMSLMMFLNTLLLIKGELFVELTLNRYRDTLPGKMGVFRKLMLSQRKGSYRDLAELVLRNSEVDGNHDVNYLFGGPERAKTIKREQLTLYQVENYLWECLRDRFEQSIQLERKNLRNEVSQYLSIISKSASKILQGVVSDNGDITLFVKLLEPLIDRLSRRDNLVIRDVEEFKNQVDKQAEQHRINLMEIKGLLASRQFSDDTQKVSDVETLLTGFSVPIGLEAGAPELMLRDFFRFPLAAKKTPQEKEKFSQHIRYLELATAQSRFDANLLDRVKETLPSVPEISYRKWYDIFPFDQFDETKLLVVFSLWRNQMLDRLMLPTSVDDES